MLCQWIIQDDLPGSNEGQSSGKPDSLDSATGLAMAGLMEPKNDWLRKH